MQLLVNCNAFCFENAGHYIIIHGCKLLKIFELVLMFSSNEPIKVVYIKK